MAQYEVNYQLLKTTIEEEYFRGFEKGETLPSTMRWNFKFNFKFDKIDDNQTDIHIYVAHEFYNSANEELFVYLAISNHFEVKGFLPDEEKKMYLLAVLFDNTVGNQQGYYAAKVPKNELNNFIPLYIDLYDYEADVLNTIKYEW